MALSLDAVKRMIHALASAVAGNEVASAMNTNSALSAQSSHSMAALVIATSTSTTTDFAALRVGDRVIHIPASAGNSDSSVVATAGTLPAAAVVGDSYLVFRAFTAPAASAVIL